jgi:hypothetical protein
LKRSLIICCLAVGCQRKRALMRGLCNARGYRLPELVSPLEMMEY